MYQSLYRKYRPRNFNEVVGQDIVVKTLIHTIKNFKLTHAYLFTGPRGTGKTSIAKILAKTVNCENPVNAIPCEECVNCTQFNNKQNADIIEIDAASNNGVDEIRELKNKISIVPSNGKYKIYIIDEVHMLTVGAFNALLKTLEEPPSHVIFILATTEPHKIPSTILSRCQRFDFKKINVDNIKKQLLNICDKESVEITEEALFELARISDGGMRDALSLLDQAISYSEGKISVEDIHEINGTLPQSQLKKLFKSINEKNIYEVFNILDDYDKRGKNFIKITDEFILFLRNMLLAIQTPEYLKMELQNADFYIDLISDVQVENILEYIECFNQGMSEMKLSNNPRLNLEILLIKLMKNNKTINLSQINQDAINIPQEKKKNINKKSNDKCLEKTKSGENETKVILHDESYINDMKRLKNIRINNTLCNFDKKLYLQGKKELEMLNQYVLHPDYSKYASLILDGELKAVGNNNFIFVFDDPNDSDIYNENVLKIDELLKQIFNNKISSISVSKKEWEIIKHEFNNHVKEYKYIEELEEYTTFLKKNRKSTNSIENSFVDLIEYK